MCGLVGIVALDGRPPSLPVLQRMGELIAYRGPDDVGSYSDERVALYHRRLAIIDLVSGRQPMSRDGVTVVFNGEIYNYLELREELRQRGETFHTTSDTEVLLCAYKAFGPDFVRRLNGMFAFLLYDAPRRQVLAARDHFGIKPLYHTSVDGQLLFASEIKALLAFPGVVAAPDCDALNDYLTFQYVLGERTLFQGIRKLLPGHYTLTDLETGAVRTVCYWEPNFRVDQDHTENYFTTELRRRLERSITWQLRSDVPVGAHLSGGLDSSLVTLLAARHLPGGIKTFTGGFDPGSEFDETRYARLVAAEAGAEAFEIFPTGEQLIELIPRLIWHMDEPAAGPGLFPQFAVSQCAASHVKVVLGGQGGDEVFGGYARYVVAYLEQALKGAIHETNEEQEHIVSLKTILPNLPSLAQYTPMMQYFWGDGVFAPMDRRYYRLIDRSAGNLRYLADDLRQAYDPEAVFARFQTVFNHPETLSYYNKMTHYDLRTNLPALLHVEDRMSMAVSLESRVPLLDYEIVDLVTAMPPRMKFRGAEMKYILKRAIRDILPPAVLGRKDKMGFPVPLHRWMQPGHPVKEFVCDLLLGPTCLQRGIFDPAGLRAVLESPAPFDRQLWGALSLELWFRQFIDRR